MADKLKSPPASAPDPLPDLLKDDSRLLWRVHAEPDPLNPPSYSRGRFRFDAPAGEFAVTYANADHDACFAEVYGDRRQIPADHGDRYLSVLFADRPLNVIALDRGPTLSALGTDNRIATSTEYHVTMEWSLALHGWYPDADAIRYLGRKATDQLNYCFYLDRCASDLEVRRLDQLKDLERVVKAVATQWSLGFSGFDPKAGAWP
jgi:hypothetical protein